MSRMDFRPLLVVAALIAAVVWLTLSGRDETIPLSAAGRSSAVPSDGLQPILPLKSFDDLDPGQVALGEQLFRDTRLSGNFTVACLSCHDPAKGGVDGRQFSTGIGGAIGGINAPTVLNAAYNLAQFWDGRASSLETQAAGPIHNPLEMGSNWTQVLGRLREDKEMVERFARAYLEGLTADNIVHAIASYERSLVTVNGRFDRFLKGEKQVLTPIEIDGYRRFREYGCASCHQGMLLGGNMYQKFGVMGDYFAGKALTKEDLGRFNVTQREEDRHVFKVPSLRNIELTAPYFHDGSAPTLESAVSVMGRYQLGRDLSAQDIQAIVAFLKTLSGPVPQSGAQ